MKALRREGREGESPSRNLAAKLSVMRSLRWLLFSFSLAFVAIAAGTGCATTSEQENAAERPWNRPQGWEQGIPGMNLPH